MLSFIFIVHISALAKRAFHYKLPMLDLIPQQNQTHVDRKVSYHETWDLFWCHLSNISVKLRFFNLPKSAVIIYLRVSLHNKILRNISTITMTS